MAEELNLYQKLAKIRALCDVTKKSKKGYGYTYADIVEILANVSAGMKKYGVTLIPSIVPGTANVQQNVTVDTKIDKAGNSYDKKSTEMLVSAEMIYTWVNDENPEDKIEVPWFVVGAQSDPSMSFGGGLTFCNRYFLTNYFQIAQTDNDVDAFRSKQKEAEASEERAVAEEIIHKVDVIVRDYLTEHEDQRDAVAKFIKKFVKSGNYLTIKEPNLAAKLLADFNKTFLGKEGD